MDADRRRGFALVLVSASGFASLAVFGKRAYAAGFTVTEVLAVRFVIATPLLALVALAAKRSLRVRGPVALRTFAMGAVGYAVQATLFFSALSRIPASLTGLLLYLYPALVTVGAVALGRTRVRALTVAGLALAFAGIAVIVGLPSGHIDALCVALGLASAVWYSGYILIGEYVLALDDTDPLVVSVYVCLGAATSFVVVGGLLGRLGFEGVRAGGWLALTGMAVVATALAIATFFAGMARIGSTWASITSSWEPVCTVILSVLVLGDRLSVGTVVGGAAVVIGAVVLPLVGGKEETVRAPA